MIQTILSVKSTYPTTHVSTKTRSVPWSVMSLLCFSNQGPNYRRYSHHKLVLPATAHPQLRGRLSPTRAPLAARRLAQTPTSLSSPQSPLAARRLAQTPSAHLHRSATFALPQSAPAAMPSERAAQISMARPPTGDLSLSVPMSLTAAHTPPAALCPEL